MQLLVALHVPVWKKQCLVVWWSEWLEKIKRCDGVLLWTIPTPPLPGLSPAKASSDTSTLHTLVVVFSSFLFWFLPFVFQFLFLFFPPGSFLCTVANTQWSFKKRMQNKKVLFIRVVVMSSKSHDIHTLSFAPSLGMVYYSYSRLVGMYVDHLLCQGRAARGHEVKCEMYVL